MDPIQMLWIGDRLSIVERLSIASFLANGHEVHLYAYQPIAAVPSGTTLRDAAEILPAANVFTYADGFGKGSPAVFANEFRYKLLLERGGVWSDTDIVCLKPMRLLEAMPYAIASERIRPGFEKEGNTEQLNSCFLKAPAGSAFMRDCHEACASADREALRWGDTGPKLATRMFLRHGLQQYALTPEVICPIDWWETRRIFEDPVPDSPQCHAVHLWNEVWRHLNVDKDGSYNPSGAFEILKRRYRVASP